MRKFSPALSVLACACATVMAYAPVAARQQQPVVPADTYADDAARELVRLARIRRSMVDHRIVGYETRAFERISAGLRTPIGERLLFRRETAAQISWTRDTVRIHVLGAREVLPPVRGAPQIPAGLAASMPALAFDPVDSEMLLRLDTTVLRHPLAAGSEQHYRYAAGDSTVIVLPDGRRVRLRELRVQPRRADPRLISGSFWIDAETHAVVQAYFRLARAYERRGRGMSVGGELDYIAIDYGLWQLRWWLPRMVAAHGVVHLAGLRVPLRFERRYEDYAVSGDTTALPTLAEAPDSVPARLCRPRAFMTVNARLGGAAVDTSAEAAVRREAEPDSAWLARRDSVRHARAAQADSTDVCDRAFIITREGPAELLTSPLLPASIYEAESLVADAAELRAIARRLRGIPSAPWRLQPPVLEGPLNRPALLRYNRVEGLSVGARALLDVGALIVAGEARVGTAAGEVGAELGVQRAGDVVQARVAAYRRLAAVDVAAQPFGLQSSLRALALGRDENDYFRASGAELRIAPPEVRPQSYDVRLFAERQTAVAARTDFSLARLVDGDRGMRPNIGADGADQIGATLRLRTGAGLSPAEFRWGAELELHGEIGDFRFARPALRMRTSLPVGSRVAIGAEIAGGSGFGSVPAQRLWQIGGTATLRGYDAAAARGEAYWRARGELGFGLPFARLVVFSDAGWAGARSALQHGRALRATGVGLGLLDGLLRFDLARAARTGAWKVHLQFDGVL